LTSAPPDDGIIRNQAGAQALVGYIVDVGQPDGLARAILDIGPQHANRIGVLHGGIIAMLLDAACGFTASQQLGEGDPLTPLVTVSLTTQFVSAARIGSRVTAVGYASGGGKTTGFVTGALRDDDDRLIATASGVFRRIKSGRAA
jgi:uncharacterized protein (TIGR00369 family)